MSGPALLPKLPLLLLLALVPASAQTPRDDRLPLGELIEIVVLEDELLAVDAEGGGTSALRRRLGEQVLWVGTRGLLGVVLTDQRILAVATRSRAWQEVVYERGEAPARTAELGDRVALVVLSGRVLGFVGGAGRLVELRLGPREELAAARVGANVGVVVTDRHAHGLSPEAGFAPFRLQLREKLEEVVARDNLATVRTDRRVLVFRGPSATWAERRN